VFAKEVSATEKLVDRLMLDTTGCWLSS
jgi:hypothetical protein